MPSLRGLVSALAQAGGGDLLFRYTIAVQSCSGEGGALQTDIAVCGELSPCSSHTGFAPLNGVCAFPVHTAQAPGCSIWSGPCVECGSSFRVLHKSADSVAPVFCVFPGLSGPGSQGLGRPLPECGAPFPSAGSRPGSQRLGRTFPGCSAPFPSAAPARDVGWVSGSLQTGTGACCSVGGGGFSGAEFAPFPSPCLLPPAGMGRLFSGVSQSLCFPNRRQVNFSLLSHSLKKLPPIALRAGPSGRSLP